MRHLIIMRHAKAERGDGKADYDRGLEDRGWRDAERVGAALAAAKLIPDLVLCSAALRTRETFAALLPHIPSDCTVELRRALYEAEASDLRAAVAGAKGSTVLVIGHNPAIQAVAAALAGQHPGASTLRTSFPTSQAAIFNVGFGIESAQFERVIAP